MELPLLATRVASLLFSSVFELAALDEFGLILSTYSAKMSLKRAQDRSGMVIDERVLLFTCEDKVMTVSTKHRDIVY